MVKIYETNLINPIIRYQGTDEDMVKYLTELWKEDFKLEKEVVEKKYNSLPKNIKLDIFKNTLHKISDNLIFRGNFGAYDDMLEKEMSLNKKSIIMSDKKCRELYLCFNDLIRYNSIRTEIFNNIKFATVFIKHKKGDDKDPKNFRFLSNHSNSFKILDKFWTNNLINSLKRKNKLPDKNLVKNNFDRNYSVSIRDLALDKITKFKEGIKIVLLDITKAFDSVSWNILESLLVKNLTSFTS